MSNTTDCLSTFPATTPQFLAPILSCQTSSSSSPFCWPPNNTRICTPTSSRLPIFWPPNYYLSNSKISIEWDLSGSSLPGGDNSGNVTVDIGRQQWDKNGVVVDGKEEEKSVRMYMRSRVSGSSEIQNHEGPTIILVKTSDFPSPTPSSRPSFKDDDDDFEAFSGLSKGGMAGVIIGIIAGIIALITACCCLGACTCCGVQKGGKRVRRGVLTEEDMGVGVGKAERRAMVAAGVQLKDVGGVRASDGPGEAVTTNTLDPGRRVLDEEAGIVGERRDEIVRVEEPPPKYTP